MKGGTSMISRRTKVAVSIFFIVALAFDLALTLYFIEDPNQEANIIIREVLATGTLTPLFLLIFVPINVLLFITIWKSQALFDGTIGISFFHFFGGTSWVLHYSPYSIVKFGAFFFMGFTAFIGCFFLIGSVFHFSRVMRKYTGTIAKKIGGERFRGSINKTFSAIPIFAKITDLQESTTKKVVEAPLAIRFFIDKNRYSAFTSNQLWFILGWAFFLYAMTFLSWSAGYFNIL